ncbi:hypothetical protein ASF71_16705 [Deinococcus sp. Leaf326]|nr:hypothetical protein ASF71_16705 [Deinococcus sp. Leaf326]
MQPDQQPDQQEPLAPAEAAHAELKDCFPQLFTRFAPQWREHYGDAQRVNEEDLRRVLRQVNETRTLYGGVSALLDVLDMRGLTPPIRQTGFFQELLALRDLFDRAARDGDLMAHEMAVKVAAGQLVQRLKETPS